MIWCISSICPPSYVGDRRTGPRAHPCVKLSIIAQCWWLLTANVSSHRWRTRCCWLGGSGSGPLTRLQIQPGLRAAGAGRAGGSPPMWGFPHCCLEASVLVTWASLSAASVSSQGGRSFSPKPVIGEIESESHRPLTTSPLKPHKLLLLLLQYNKSLSQSTSGGLGGGCD